MIIRTKCTLFPHRMSATRFFVVFTLLIRVHKLFVFLERLPYTEGVSKNLLGNKKSYHLDRITDSK